MNFRIRDARKKCGLNQKELASKLGIANTTLSGYETGASDPGSDMLVRIADICDCTVDFLLNNDKHISVTEEEDLIHAFSRLYAALNDIGKQIVRDTLSSVERAGLVLTTPVPRPEEE